MESIWEAFRHRQGECAFKWKTFNQCMWLVLTYGSEKWVLIWKTGRRLTVVQVVTEWLILWVTNRERICNSFSWATDSRKQCDLEKHRTWSDPGQVTWLQGEMTDKTNWWSNGSQRDALGKEQWAEAKGSNEANQKWLRLGVDTVHTRGEMKDNNLPGLKLVQLWFAHLHVLEHQNST